MANPTHTQTELTKIEDRITNTLLDARRIFLSEGIDNETAADVIRKIWYLELKDPGKPILLILNCPGGSVDSGFAIWDQLKMISSPVYTLVTGLAASMGSILSLAAAKGKRFATKNARIMIHQPSIHGIVQGQATDLEIQAKEIIKTRDAIVNVYCEATGKDAEAVSKAIDRDSWMTAEEALKFGLLDKIVGSYDELK